MDQNVLLLLSFLVAFQMFFIGIFLVTSRKGIRRNNRLLGLIFLLIGWNMADFMRQVSRADLGLGVIQYIDDAFILLYGPLMYLYVQLVIHKRYVVKKTYWLHLVPYLLLTVSFLLTYRAADGSSAGLTDLETQSFMSQVIGICLYLHVLTYVALGLLSLRRYRTILLDQFSRIDHINLSWLGFVLKALAVLTVLSLLHNAFVLSGNEYVYGITVFPFLLFVAYFSNHILFKALKQPEIFAGIDTQVDSKYAGSNLTSELAETYRNRLAGALETDKLYREPDLSLSDLAERLDIPPKLLSQVINQSFGKNFFDFVNSYRVAEAKEIFGSGRGKHQTVLEVMYEVGFNSKSSFNTAFKKATGQTPTRFRENL